MSVSKDAYGRSLELGELIQSLSTAGQIEGRLWKAL